MNQIADTSMATKPRALRLVRTFTLAAVLAASTLVIPQAAEAGPHGHGGGGWHGGGGGFHGGGGRWWGGRYYGYGAGRCWHWNPFYARWVWVCY